MITRSARRSVAIVGAALCVGAVAMPAAQAASPAWRISKILNMKDYADLVTLTADGSHDAWTFGQTSTGKPVALHWNGATWTASSVPGAFTRPGFVSSTSPGNVWVGGSECTGGPPGPDVTATYVDRYNGHKWATSKWKTTAYCGAALVTTGPKNGWLLGNNQALHFTGRNWHKVPVPSLGQVIAATAVSATDIWTVGGRFNAFHESRSKAFFTHYNGRVWREVPLPAIKLPKYGYLYPYDIEAATASSIWAAVTIEPAASHSFLLHWNGSKWRSIPLPAAPYQLLQVTPDGSGGVWAIMFPSVNGAYQFAHYSNGHWSFDAVPTNGLTGLIPPATFDVYAIARIPGTRSMLATGDVFYSTATNSNARNSLIFSYGS
ncbi:MAG: hypothetical protein ACLQFR_20020 [Streptosporangiaceae bacterium]